MVSSMEHSRNSIFSICDSPQKSSAAQKVYRADRQTSPQCARFCSFSSKSVLYLICGSPRHHTGEGVKAWSISLHFSYLSQRMLCLTSFASGLTDGSRPVSTNPQQSRKPRRYRHYRWGFLLLGDTMDTHQFTFATLLCAAQVQKSRLSLIHI